MPSLAWAHTCRSEHDVRFIHACTRTIDWVDGLIECTLVVFTLHQEKAMDAFKTAMAGSPTPVATTNAQYLEAHPEVRAVLNDFMSALLFEKPEVRVRVRVMCVCLHVGVLVKPSFAEVPSSSCMSEYSMPQLPLFRHDDARTCTPLPHGTSRGRTRCPRTGCSSPWSSAGPPAWARARS